MEQIDAEWTILMFALPPFGRRVYQELASHVNGKESPPHGLPTRLSGRVNLSG